MQYSKPIDTFVAIVKDLSTRICTKTIIKFSNGESFLNQCGSRAHVCTMYAMFNICHVVDLVSRDQSNPLKSN